MKRAFLAAAMLAAATTAFAQTKAETVTHRATGVVTKVDAAKGRVTIKHGPVRTLGWPGMTMAFGVKDKATLEKMPKDKEIDFEFVQQGRDYVVTSLK
jgi:Cu(I)/Ag(I) efflux system protein CusF